MPFNVALFAPEIPQNTGNIIRLCANTGARLHLIEPLGFSLHEKHLRRASLDYRHLTDVTVHKSFRSFLASVSLIRTFAAMVGQATTYNRVEYRDGDTIIFGPESRGLPDEIVSELPLENRIGIPMMPSNRSINISNAVAVVMYEMWRQQCFSGAESPTPNSERYFS